MAADGGLWLGGAWRLFSITDSYDPLSNRRAFYDTSHLLPAAMLESYVEKWPAPRLENFLYMLRSGMMVG